MTQRSVTHSTFVIERTYGAAPARVFQAWSSAEAKARWFVGPEGWAAVHREVDFRVGGHEQLIGKGASGTVSTFDAHYHDIVADQRIVYSYSMRLDDKRISVSLATIEFEPAGQGTRLIVTEQGAFLDGYDDAGGRERGTAGLLDKLAAALERERAGA
jgi:uncharacterized protein YndB with AHSA1/START domain